MNRLYAKDNMFIEDEEDEDILDEEFDDTDDSSNE